ncbi:MAG: hypothetical protein QGI83_13240, partial [Candidatus Latescibacteria bacterium]|nr:hypothetical protein [Candidatus Latescibacterota bacterium]
MARVRSLGVPALVVLAVLVALPEVLFSQEYVVFKVNTHFDMGRAVPDSARANDYYVKIGAQEGITIGTVLNVYRDKEI